MKNAGWRAFVGALGFLFALAFPVSATAGGEGIRTGPEAEVASLVSELGPGSSVGPAAGISTISRSSFVRRANRVCAAQVPALRRHAQRLSEFERLINEANAAGDLELLQTYLNRMANAIVPVTRVLGQRHTKIRRLKPVRGINPRPVLTRLAAMNRAFRDTIRAMRALASDPSMETANRADAVAKRLERTGKQYLRINQRLGLRSCSRQIY